MDRLPRRRRRHRVGVRHCSRHPRRSDPAWIVKVFSLPQPRAQSPHSGARPLPQPVLPMGTSPSSHVPGRSAGKDAYSWRSRPRESARRSSGTKTTKKNSGSRPDKSRPRPPSVPPQQPSTNDPFTGGGDPRERVVRQHPGRVEQPSGGECGAGLDRQGGDIGDLHPPGARPDVQANHMSGLSPAIGD